MACYARGAPRTVHPSKGGAPLLLRALRVEGANRATASEAARKHGLLSESLLLQDEALLDWAFAMLQRGEVITFESNGYPDRLRRSLGGSAPPVIWKRGVPPNLPYLAVLGSREISAPVKRFAVEAAEAITKAGYALASGGAKGVDRAAATAVLRRFPTGPIPLTEVLPCGIRRVPGTAACTLSLASPEEEFSGALAMERNLVLYAMSEATLVVEARFKEGGAWHGAVEALRRKLTRVMIRSDPNSQAHRALAALGATVIRSPEDIEAFLATDPIQPRLL